MSAKRKPRRRNRGMMRAMRSSVSKSKPAKSRVKKVLGWIGAAVFGALILGLIAVQGMRLFAPHTIFLDSTQRFEILEVGERGGRVEILGTEQWLSADDEVVAGEDGLAVPAAESDAADTGPLEVGDGVFVTYRYRGPAEDREVLVEAWEREPASPEAAGDDPPGEASESTGSESDVESGDAAGAGSPGN